MPHTSREKLPNREEILRRIRRASRYMLQGNLSGAKRKCGNLGCRCQKSKSAWHGPHTYLTLTKPDGKRTGCYVPADAVADARRGVAAWKDFWSAAVALSDLNRAEFRALWRSRRRG